MCRILIWLLIQSLITVLLSSQGHQCHHHNLHRLLRRIIIPTHRILVLRVGHQGRPQLTLRILCHCVGISKPFNFLSMLGYAKFCFVIGIDACKSILGKIVQQKSCRQDLSSCKYLWISSIKQLLLLARSTTLPISDINDMLCDTGCD
ncbi:uncharacterized protein LOC111386027 [Olea europaea var. sylvestris]|uniref:uncharacterized protein LOC111386027 n=1 Tax=Olea europaea var. sylvestris TaxID=158386 RepID=UPI000C1D2A85|nr:uncharacterized protein LOC111386027 [Olea europaea var. sylvestris]